MLWLSLDKSPGNCYNAKCSFAGLAQLVEQLICNQQVGGSSPSTSSKNPVHESGRDFYFLLLTSSLLPQNKIHTGFLGSNK